MKKKYIIHHPVSHRDKTTVDHIDRWGREVNYPEGSLGYATAYHYVIEGDGKITQTRKEDEWVKHLQQKEKNNGTVAICVTGCFEDLDDMPLTKQISRYGKPKPTEEQIKSLWSIVNPYWNDFCGHGQVEGEDTLCPGEFLKEILDKKKEDISNLKKNKKLLFIYGAILDLLQSNNHK